MSESKKVFYYYSKDPSKTEDGKVNPIPKKLRQRRQVIAGVIQDGDLLFGKSECSHHDVFRKITGRNKAAGLAVSRPIEIIKIKEGSAVGNIFVTKAKELITPGPEVEVINKVTYRKAK